VIVATWEEFLAERTAAGDELRQRPCRLTVGAFDGLHLGHRRLIDAVTDSGPLGAGHGPGHPIPVVVTFRRPPGQVLGTAGRSGLILSLAQKLRRMAELAVGAAVLIDFSEEISTLSGREFIDLLRGRLAIERIVVGPNFRFGRHRDADVRDLEAMLAGGPTTVQTIEPVLRGGEIVSSSRIRRAIRDGDLDGAAAMLAAPHEIDLAGAATEPGAVLHLARAAVDQVLPTAGTFAVTGLGPDGEVPGTLEAAADTVVVRLAREASIATLAFGRGQGNERSPRDGIEH
jgi:riboflavin kinase / FMN adenylyltransferase